MQEKHTFTYSEYQELLSLIKQRVDAPRDKQKTIRAKMRRIGFFGGNDFGIKDLTIDKFEDLIRTGQIKIVGMPGA